MGESLAVLYLIGFIFVLILAVCWIILPFALIGTKPILKDLLAEARQMNAHLTRVAAAAHYLAQVKQESMPKPPQNSPTTREPVPPPPSLR